MLRVFIDPNVVLSAAKKVEDRIASGDMPVEVLFTVEDGVSATVITGDGMEHDAN